ncbi:hypothetical protein TNIN_181151 [Trichonephila inaurata madagascariensis]|uniref:Uncharacterized protein n=1 Tax=Trichonephila inaurata madagascariensis TaxID=2747483 RepID=A0A8X6XWI7_9ARAC|nr:hypothetical protein TNIN_181151 [Trichonephila inaurata madagascariensis]
MGGHSDLFSPSTFHRWPTFCFLSAGIVLRYCFKEMRRVTFSAISSSSNLSKAKRENKGKRMVEIRKTLHSSAKHLDPLLSRSDFLISSFIPESLLDDQRCDDPEITPPFHIYYQRPGETFDGASFSVSRSSLPDYPDNNPPTLNPNCRLRMDPTFIFQTPW